MKAVTKIPEYSNDFKDDEIIKIYWLPNAPRPYRKKVSI
jgi:hypothetical protein